MNTKQATEIEITSESSAEDMFQIEIDDAPDIKFSGDLIAKASSSPDTAMGSSYSGSTGRWTKLRLYKTKGGKFVCEKVEKTQWQGERDTHLGKVCQSINGVFEFFGHDWLAKELYADGSIDAVVEIK